jgi:two-component system sensor histidine kinase EvgS
MKNRGAGATPAEQAADMAHELRSPLGGIESMLAQLSEATARSDQEALIAGLKAAAAHLRNVANAMLRPESPAGEATPVADAIRMFAVSARSRAAAAGHAFRCDVAADCEGVSVANGTALRQMLENVFDNALKHGGGNVVLRVALRGEMVEFQVVDHGPGMNGEGAAQIFRRGETMGAKSGGSGLGLAIVARLAEANGGTCGAGPRSDGATGASVWFTLPVASRKAGAEPVEDAPRGAPVLVVDDDAMSQLLMKTILGHLGYECETVGSAIEAMVVMQDRVFSAVFTDLTMPGMNGWAFIQMLRREGVEVPIVGVSGRVTPEDKRRTIEAGANWALEKPVTIHDIRQALVAIGLRDPMQRQVHAA